MIVILDLNLTVQFLVNTFINVSISLPKAMDVFDQ